MTSNLVNRELGTPIFLLKLWHLTLLLVLKLQNNIYIAFYYIVAEVPKEILFKGQRAMQLYQKALRDGFVNVYRGRIFLIGQDRAGKTSLKKSLLGVPFDPKEESTEGIDPSKCDIDVNRVQNWHVDSKNTILSEVSEQISRSLAVELFHSRQVSREKEMMASNVFYVKIVKVSNLQTFIYAFNDFIYVNFSTKFVCIRAWLKLSVKTEEKNIL